MAAGQADDEEGGGLISGINVTPLVDIVLVLLIIVMVTAPLIVHQQLAMDLPKAAKGQEQQIFFGVDIGANNEVQVDGKSVDGMEKVLPLAKEALAKNAELRATIRADSSVPHGTVMRVVDLLKQAGISRIAFGVSQTAPEIDKTPVPVNP